MGFNSDAVCIREKMEIGGSSESPAEAKKSKSKTPRKPKDAQLLKQSTVSQILAELYSFLFSCRMPVFVSKIYVG